MANLLSLLQSRQRHAALCWERYPHVARGHLTVERRCTAQVYSAGVQRSGWELQRKGKEKIA